ncbi:hypothetical protein [Cytobacillus oceanisediminis]|uniref:hypothetical protein n=1 Tax=Cytobacillus oceanisediminis TaxID=665099 RepID=UPI001FB4EDF3|nr:hypothetical protein [Cytobacillus oceanisediminis]
MAFILVSLVFVIVCILFIQRMGIKNPFSKGIGLAIAVSTLAAISLAQNYTQSLIPEANDGISISNVMAYWIIGEPRWSQEIFKNFFNKSIYITLILIVSYPITLMLESTLGRNSA